MSSLLNRHCKAVLTGGILYNSCNVYITSELVLENRTGC